MCVCVCVCVCVCASLSPPSPFHHCAQSMRDFDSFLSSIGVSSAAPETLKWSDFGGYASITDRLKRYLRRGSGTRGIVLHGPSGCGKVRGYMCVYETSYNFVSIRSADLLSQYFGQTEEAIRAVFAHARQSAPCVLFFDDFDALGCRRAAPAVKSGSASHDLGARVLSTFLNELDGVTGGQPNLVVIIACSSLHSLDEALVRPGRMSHHFHMNWPTLADCGDILRIKLRGMPVDLVPTVSCVASASASAEAEADVAVSADWTHVPPFSYELAHTR
eukprot:GSChrysophyteH2.ASY1.ANO1.1200.1 assembled CDS